MASNTTLAQDQDASSTELEEIIVTATRKESELSKTPVAVSVVGGSELMSAGITNPTELVDRVPGLSIDRANGLQLTIRGVSSTDNTEKGDPSAAFLLDGVYIARPQAQEVSFFDLDRVEVVRGPQGTLYGRNTTAGLINVISAKPQDEFSASLDGSFGDFESQQLTGMVNVPLSEKVALRGAVNYDRRDTYLIENPGTPFDGVSPKDSLSGRLGVLFKFSDATDLWLQGDYSQIEGDINREDAFGSVPISNLYEMPLTVPPPGTRGVDPRYLGGSSKEIRTIPYVDPVPFETDDNTWGLKAEFNWHLNDATTLTYLGSYREFERDESFPLYSGYAGPPGLGFHVLVPAIFTGSYDQNSHELRVAFDGERFDFQSGLYYFKESSGILLALFGALPFAPNPGDDGYVFGFPQEPTDSESRAVFGQGTFSVTDTFRLTAGVRYTEDDKSRVGATIFHRTLDEAIDFVASPTNPNPDSLNNAAVSYEKTTWRAGLEFDLGDASLLYASVATGYKAGGFNDGCLDGEPNCNPPGVVPEALFYDPEELTSYELGLRSTIAGKARIFASYFHYDYTDLQLSSLSSLCGGPCQVTSNAGEAEVDGIEFETQIQINERNRLDGGISWLDAVYTDYEVTPGLNFAGEALNRSPEWTASLGYAHTVPLANGGKLVFDVHSRYVDEYFMMASAISAQFRQPSFTKTDVTIGYYANEDTWYVEAFGKNLEDEVTVGAAGLPGAFPALNDGTLSLSAPITYGMRLGYKF